jgi:hypothetical protein
MHVHIQSYITPATSGIKRLFCIWLLQAIDIDIEGVCCIYNHDYEE